MARNREQEGWIEDVMNSLNGAQRLPADPEMYDKVMQRMRSAAKDRTSNTFRKLAVAAMILLTVNIMSVLHYMAQTKVTTQQNVKEVVSGELNTLSETGY